MQASRPAPAIILQAPLQACENCDPYQNIPWPVKRIKTVPVSSERFGAKMTTFKVQYSPVSKCAGLVAYRSQQCQLLTRQDNWDVNGSSAVSHRPARGPMSALPISGGRSGCRPWIQVLEMVVCTHTDYCSRWLCLTPVCLARRDSWPNTTNIYNRVKPKTIESSVTAQYIITKIKTNIKFNQTITINQWHLSSF